MTCVELYQLMKQPQGLSKHTLNELKEILHDYPYFHAATMLYLKNLSLEEDLRLSLELRRMAIQLPDRSKLYFLLQEMSGERVKPNESEVMDPLAESCEKQEVGEEALNDSARATSGSNVTETEKIDEVPIVSLQEAAPPVEVKSEGNKVYQPTLSDDYISWMQKNEQLDDVEALKFQGQELIDSFIEQENERAGNRRSLQLDEQLENEKKEKNEGPVSLGEKGLDDSYFTETLAHVYVRQKRYDKALEIIRNLSLRNPEKNAYFADQIRFLERLIIHTKH